jgi:hypothetical protein
MTRLDRLRRDHYRDHHAALRIALSDSAHSRTTASRVFQLFRTMSTTTSKVDCNCTSDTLTTQELAYGA